MQSVLVLNKQIGETPLECMNRFREAHPEYRDIKMTYAGRLDPIASGALLVLVGDAVFDKEKYLTLPKTYTCTAILGIKTDTYDVLGIPSCYQEKGVGMDFEKVKMQLKSFVGTFFQSYPPYSSKTIHGKQMHQLTRSGNLVESEIPEREVTVFDVRNISFEKKKINEVYSEIFTIVSKVKGDFRQQEILESWKKMVSCHENTEISLVTFTIEVSSGTYIRGIVNELGKKLARTNDEGACILRLSREKVGDEKLDK